MKFRTEIETLDISSKIEYSNSLFFIGSCFASNIGSECEQSGLSVMINPFGATYNPLSIIEILKIIEKKDSVNNSMFRNVDGKWCSLMHNSSFNSDSSQELRDITDKSIKVAHKFINSCSYLFVTLGTSWVYEEVFGGQIVNNCHKIKSSEFIRKKLSINEIVDAFSELIENSAFYSDKNIVFTVSPIRHLKDSIIGNSISKATLLVSISILCEKYPSKCIYFPSYEIMVDDLRDYRYYEADMIHPSKVAIDYIYEYFGKMFFTHSTMDYASQMEKISRAMSHKVIDQESIAHIKFKKSMVDTLLSLKSKYPLADYDSKILFFK